MKTVILHSFLELPGLRTSGSNDYVLSVMFTVIVGDFCQIDITSGELNST